MRKPAVVAEGRQRQPFSRRPRLVRPEHLNDVGHRVAALRTPGEEDQRRAERRQAVAYGLRDEPGQVAAQQVEPVDHSVASGSGALGALPLHGAGGRTPRPPASPRMNASTRSCASSSACWTGGDFMKYADGPLQRAAEAAVERQLGAAHGVDHDAGRVRRVPDLQLQLDVQRHIAEGAPSMRM